MIPMVKLDDANYVPRDCCTVTNPMTRGGVSVVDDVEMPCGLDCDGGCDECVMQKILTSMLN